MAASGMHFMDGAHVATVSPEELQEALAQSVHCVVIQGTTRQFYDRVDSMGIEVTRGDGLHFVKGNVTFPFFFICDQFEVDGTCYLRFGLGNSLDFAKKIPAQELQREVRMRRQGIHVMHGGQSIGNIPRDKLLLALETHPHCILVRGTMEEYDSQQERLGIENCRGSGQCFAGHEHMGTFACQQVSENWLRIGQGSYTKFLRAFSKAQIQEAVVSRLD